MMSAFDELSYPGCISRIPRLYPQSGSWSNFGMVSLTGSAPIIYLMNAELCSKDTFYTVHGEKTAKTGNFHDQGESAEKVSSAP